MKQDLQMKFVRLFIALSFVTTVTGCTSLPKPDVNPNSASQDRHQAHLQDIAGIDQFSIKGRIGVQAEGKGFSGSLTWQHSKINDDIALYSPLGGQLASIKKTSENVTLEDAKGNSITAADAETLTQKTLGWQLPLAGLADWSLGRPSSSAIQASTWNEQGYLSTLKQDGWDIQYENYTDQNGHFLPSKILLRNEKVYLKLLVESWSRITNSSIANSNTSN
ncbi:lipoprotein insertase outer membrane protein LolB [Methylotenera sp.]|uniref:lipoprotein insertase outer membrane protein LolB n=1 Tax=Methylotenera sp. TaxID=2051956 RepID=UPI002487029D|nr:lipoprotein insertase outer membrane protein LolB [Methylotenera sp.]MDI1361970.1 lipoprotein insertase outer membrane protein LolB [Methylotenera sp.]